MSIDNPGQSVGCLTVDQYRRTIAAVPRVTIGNNPWQHAHAVCRWVTESAEPCRWVHELLTPRTEQHRLGTAAASRAEAGRRAPARTKGVGSVRLMPGRVQSPSVAGGQAMTPGGRLHSGRAFRALSCQANKVELLGYVGPVPAHRRGRECVMHGQTGDALAACQLLARHRRITGGLKAHRCKWLAVQLQPIDKGRSENGCEADLQLPQ